MPVKIAKQSIYTAWRVFEKKDIIPPPPKKCINFFFITKFPSLYSSDFTNEKLPLFTPD